MEQRPSHPSHQITVGSCVKKARTAAKLSLREVARRAGISAAQLSRIESGETTRPEERTIAQLATALGRPVAPLLYIGGYMGNEELWYRVPEAVHDYGEDWSAVAPRAREAFLGTTLAGMLDRFSDLGYAGYELDLEVIGNAWSGLTSERRARVISYVEDQLALSVAERRREARRK